MSTEPLTIMTLLRGDRALTERWVHVIANLERPEGTKIVCGVTTEHDRQMAHGQGAETVQIPPYTDTDETGRCRHVAKIKELVLLHVTTALVLWLDDDIVPPADGLTTLIQSMPKDAVGICGVYPFNPAYAFEDCAPIWQAAYRAPIMLHEAPRRLFGIWAGGNAFCLWRTEPLRQSAPWHVESPEEGRLNSVEWVIGATLAARDQKVCANGTVLCRHDLLPA